VAVAKFYFAEVRDIMDPLKSGRVKVRKYGFDNDEQNIQDDHLPWALPLQPVTSAATGKVGIIPTGLIVGSRVVVAFMDNDTAEQYPIIMGSFARGAPLKE
jgi:hypothetical protein